MRLGRARGQLVIALCALAALAAGPAFAQDARFLAKEDILLYGLGLRVEPATQTVPKDIATIVSTFLQAPQQPQDLPPFAPDAVVKATLRGPGLPNALDLAVQPNSPFNIPPLTVAGVYTLENIRLESQGAVLLRATPESAKITVIDKLLVTEITARPLTAAEIREKGIVFDSSNFQAYNFTAAFALKDGGNTVKINVPVLLPSLQQVGDETASRATIDSVVPPPAAIKSLTTVVPDTLKIDLTAAAGFPNGRKLEDPVIDVTLAVVLLDLTQFHLDVSVDEVDIAQLALGQGVSVTLEGSGADARAQVNFGRHGSKWLALAIAKLTPIE